MAAALGAPVSWDIAVGLRRAGLNSGSWLSFNWRTTRSARERERRVSTSVSTALVSPVIPLITAAMLVTSFLRVSISTLAVAV